MKGEPQSFHKCLFEIQIFKLRKKQRKKQLSQILRIYLHKFYTRYRSLYITGAGTEDKMVGRRKFFYFGTGWVTRN